MRRKREWTDYFAFVDGARLVQELVHFRGIGSKTGLMVD